MTSIQYSNNIVNEIPDYDTKTFWGRIAKSMYISREKNIKKKLDKERDNYINTFKNNKKESFNFSNFIEKISKIIKKPKLYNTECPICFENLSGRTCISFECKHSHHLDCWLKWREHSKTCTLCRADVENEDNVYFNKNFTVLN